MQQASVFAAAPVVAQRRGAARRLPAAVCAAQKPQEVEVCLAGCRRTRLASRCFLHSTRPPALCHAAASRIGAAIAPAALDSCSVNPD
jgi:hypothetical protein